MPESGAVGRMTGAAATAVIGCMVACAAPAFADTTYYVNTTSDAYSAADTGCTAFDSLADVNVNPTGPSNTCTLPDAIKAATAAGGANTIMPVVCGQYTITTQLPPIPPDTTLNGGALGDSSDPAAPCYDTGPNDGGSVNEGYVNLEGSGGGPGGAAEFPGLDFEGSGSSMFGFIIGGFTNAVELGPPGDDQIYFSGIGANPFEQGDLIPENTGDGIKVLSGSAGDTIGYDPSEGQNVYQDDIYGNGGWGVELAPGSGPTTVGHNWIGTDTSGHILGPGDQGYGGNGVPATPGDGPSDGNGLGGVYVGDDSGDVIGGDVQCSGAFDVCNSNIIANNGGPGVELAPGSSHATVDGNYIGMSLDFYNDPATAGLAPLAGGVCPADRTTACPGPNNGPGVLDEGSGNTIGGTSAGAANLISSNGTAVAPEPGVELEGQHATVDGNLIGMDVAGSGAQANTGAGVLASDAANNANGFSRIASNVIGGNDGPGIELDQANNIVASNFIGTAGDKTSPLGNQVGILAERGSQTIGGPSSGANVITDNTGAGIAVVNPASGTSHTTGVLVFRNSIFNNGGLGIDLGNDGVTLNHTPVDVDGPNKFQNFPVLTSASSASGQYKIEGTLDALPGGDYTIYVYGNPQCDASGYGEGQTDIAGGTVTTDSSGHASFTLTGQGGVDPGLSLSPVAVGDGSSEFGKCLTVTGGSDLKVSQSVANNGKVIADEPVDVDIHVTNGGPADATNITLTDTLPTDGKLASQPAGCPAASGGKFVCSIGNLAAGQSEDLHVLLQPGDVQTLTNSVEADADQIQTTAGDNVSAFATAVSPNPNGPGYVIPSEPAPTFGQFVRIDRESGSVTATLPNGQVIDLKNFALVPVGTVVQTDHGVARVTAAIARNKTTSHADFKYGRFKIAQSRSQRGRVNAVMDAPLTGCSGKELRTNVARSGAHHKPKKSKRKKRELWGHAHGAFTITGNRGAATVHGTKWEVIDTCTTTTVKVFSDVVTVVGFGNTKPKHATVTAGHQVTLRAG